VNAPDWIDGREQPRPDDCGPGVFETMRLVDGAVRRLDRHLARLERGARAHGFDLRGDEVLQMERYIRAHALREGVLRLALEPSADAGRVHLSLAARAARSVPEAGVRLIVVQAPRLPLDPFCIHKRTRRGLYEHASAQARAQHAFDAILTDEAGHWVECATANLHVFAEGVWWSPGAPQGALPGLEREDFLARAGAYREQAVPPDLLPRVEAVCLTNSVLGTVKILTVEGHWWRNKPA
jgi:branched-subunit amino acid aminotransferase/4-amino-4-deoxychorismate lyase